VGGFGVGVELGGVEGAGESRYQRACRSGEIGLQDVVCGTTIEQVVILDSCTRREMNDFCRIEQEIAFRKVNTRYALRKKTKEKKNPRELLSEEHMWPII